MVCKRKSLEYFFTSFINSQYRSGILFRFVSVSQNATSRCAEATPVENGIRLVQASNDVTLYKVFLFRSSVVFAR